MLRCEGCRVRAGSFVLELDRLHVRSGEHCLIVGPSGAGKSLLLRAMAGLVKPEAGTIALRGEDAVDRAPEDRRVGLVFQHYSLFPHLSVLENVAFGPRMRGTGRRGARAEASAVLNRLGCAHLADRRPATLSGGEQQRVAIARALATGADLLLLDEPFAALDPSTRAACRIELSSLRRDLGLTIVEVTHALEEAGGHADRIVVLDGGRIVADGTPGLLAARPPSFPVARALDLENLVPADLIGGGASGWFFVSPGSVTVGPPGDAAPPGTIAFDGIVEVAEELGPICRVHLLLDRSRNGDPLRLVGFGAPGATVLAPGSRTTAWFPRDAIFEIAE